MGLETIVPKETPASLTVERLEQIERAGSCKLEYVQGLPIWEASPVYRHQKKTLDIQMSLLQSGKELGCACIPVADITILFPDGSLKRPDIAVYCEEPSEQEEATTLLPEVVIEITSKGYEKKDWEISLPFYLAHGIPDIVIFDSIAQRITHFHAGQKDEYTSPKEITFACGCRATL